MVKASSGDTKKENSAVYEMAGAALLSMQPADPVEKKIPQKKEDDWNTLRGHLEARVVQLRAWRSSWWFQNYSDLSTYIEPRRSIWMTQSTGGMPTPNNMNRGRPLNSAILDPTGTYAVRVCSSAIMTGLASPSRPWFKVIPTVKNFEIDAAGRQWLDEVESRVYTVLAQSNFYNSFAQECEDLVVYGTAPVIIYEDEKDIFRCYNPAVGEYYLSSGSTMRVDGLYRMFVMSIIQIVDFFGVENCPPDVQALWKQKGSALDTERIIAHSIEPNFGIQNGDTGKVPGNFPWREVYWVYGAGSQKPLSIRGFLDQPFTAARWSTQSNDAYGRSVGMDVLPDIIQLQVETARKAEAIEKQVRPPMLGSMDLKNQPSSILPGSLTYVSSLGPQTGMRPAYTVEPNIAAMMQDLAAIQERIKRGFFNDVLTPLMSNPGDRRTAYETAQIVVEKLSVTGSVIENIITESLKPRMRRIFGILKRKNILPPLPDSLKGVPLDVDFVSMLAIASRAASTGGLERIASLVGNLSAVFPDAKDNLDSDKFINEMNLLLDNPQSILRSPEEVASIRQKNAQMQKQDMQKQQMSQGIHDTNVGAQAAQTLASTTVGAGQTALSQLLGTAHGQ